jgi:hypothetical protein
LLSRFLQLQQDLLLAHTQLQCGSHGHSMLSTISLLQVQTFLLLQSLQVSFHGELATRILLHPALHCFQQQLQAICAPPCQGVICQHDVIKVLCHGCVNSPCLIISICQDVLQALPTLQLCHWRTKQLDDRGRLPTQAAAWQGSWGVGDCCFFCFIAA